MGIIEEMIDGSIKNSNSQGTKALKSILYFIITWVLYPEILVQFAQQK